MVRIRKGYVGRSAYRVSKVWKLGFHVFLNDEHLILRLCYFRNKKYTCYIQLEIKVRKINYHCGC